MSRRLGSIASSAAARVATAPPEGFRRPVATARARLPVAGERDHESPDRDDGAACRSSTTRFERVIASTGRCEPLLHSEKTT